MQPMLLSFMECSASGLFWHEQFPDIGLHFQQLEDTIWSAVPSF